MICTKKKIEFCSVRISKKQDDRLHLTLYSNFAVIGALINYEEDRKLIQI